MKSTQPIKLNVRECGNLHLSYQSMTLHFEKNEFLNFAAQIRRLSMKVLRDPTSQQPNYFTNSKGQVYH